jgi:hypothetical protein
LFFQSLEIRPNDLHSKLHRTIALAIFFRVIIEAAAIDARTSAAVEIIIPKGEAARKAIDTERRLAVQGTAITFPSILARRLLNLSDGRIRHPASGVKYTSPMRALARVPETTMLNSGAKLKEEYTTVVKCSIPRRG